MNIKQYQLDDGSTITAQELADALGLHIGSARKRLRRSRDRRKLFEKPGERVRGGRAYVRDGVSMTPKDICKRVPGLGLEAACTRALRWERGELSMEQMLLPKGQYRGGKDGCSLGNRGNAEWKDLGSKPRDAALKNIPSATRWEKKHMGKI